jgi:maltose alpha-D-glucosyltransferase/alpha-amylase
VRPRFNLEPDELKLAYAFLFTMPGVPFLYYGDEIGMRYLDVKTKEGGYQRTGSRTPMQWNHKDNYGFSSAAKEDLYLPVDESEDAPVVFDQVSAPDSLYRCLRRFIHFRRNNRDLWADIPLEILYAEKEKLPFVYRRGSLIMAVNPSLEEQSVHLSGASKLRRMEMIGKIRTEEDILYMEPQSLVILQ